MAFSFGKTKTPLPFLGSGVQENHLKLEPDCRAAQQQRTQQSQAQVPIHADTFNCWLQPRQVLFWTAAPTETARFGDHRRVRLAETVATRGLDCTKKAALAGGLRKNCSWLLAAAEEQQSCSSQPGQGHCARLRNQLETQQTDQVHR